MIFTGRFKSLRVITEGTDPRGVEVVVLLDTIDRGLVEKNCCNRDVRLEPIEPSLTSLIIDAVHGLWDRRL